MGCSGALLLSLVFEKEIKYVMMMMMMISIAAAPWFTFSYHCHQKLIIRASPRTSTAGHCWLRSSASTSTAQILQYLHRQFAFHPSCTASRDGCGGCSIDRTSTNTAKIPRQPNNVPQRQDRDVTKSFCFGGCIFFRSKGPYRIFVVKLAVLKRFSNIQWS